MEILRPVKARRTLCTMRAVHKYEKGSILAFVECLVVQIRYIIFYFQNHVVHFAVLGLFSSNALFRAFRARCNVHLPMRVSRP